MTLRHLRIFIIVYETLNFTKAGEILHLAQPSISLAIKELEEYYNVQLFERIKHVNYPTKECDKLYKYACQILSIVDNMEDSIKDHQENITLRIGSSITIGNRIIGKLIKEFQIIHPHVQFEIMINNCKHIEQALLDNKLDIALIENDPQNKQIHKISFMEDELCVIAHPSHHLHNQLEISLDDISKENILSREHGSSVRELVDSIFLTHQIGFHPIWQSSSTHALINGVKDNIGISILPYTLVKDVIDKKEVVTLDVEELKVKRHYNIVYHNHKYLSSILKEFIDYCLKAYLHSEV